MNSISEPNKGINQLLLEACKAAMYKIEAYENCSPTAEVISAEDMPEEWELCRAAIKAAHRSDGGS